MLQIAPLDGEDNLLRRHASMGDQPNEPRQATEKGRKGFAKGLSGNPRGRPRGRKNNSTLMAQALFDENGEAIVEKALRLALEEDNITALRICIDRLVPPIKSRPLSLAVPKIRTPQDVVAAYDSVIAAASAGEITVDEANSLSSILEAARRAIDAAEMDDRLARIEAKLGLQI